RYVRTEDVRAEAARDLASELRLIAVVATERLDAPVDDLGPGRCPARKSGLDVERRDRQPLAGERAPERLAVDPVARDVAQSHRRRVPLHREVLSVLARQGPGVEGRPDRRAHDVRRRVEKLDGALLEETAEVRQALDVRPGVVEVQGVEPDHQNPPGFGNRCHRHFPLHAARRRHRPRPSTYCQAMSPGTPETISRTRVASDVASATSGGRPMSAPSATNPPSWTPRPAGTGKATARATMTNVLRRTASRSVIGWPRSRAASQTSPDRESRASVRRPQEAAIRPGRPYRFRIASSRLPARATSPSQPGRRASRAARAVTNAKTPDRWTSTRTAKPTASRATPPAARPSEPGSGTITRSAAIPIRARRGRGATSTVFSTTTEATASRGFPVQIARSRARTTSPPMLATGSMRLIEYPIQRPSSASEKRGSSPEGKRSLHDAGERRSGGAARTATRRRVQRVEPSRCTTV